MAAPQQGNQLAALEEAILNGADLAADDVLAKHAPWVEELKTKYTFTAENTAEILKEEVGQVFAKVLEHAGVFRHIRQPQPYQPDIYAPFASLPS